MFLKKYYIIINLFIISNICFADLPVEIIQSCKNMAPSNTSITMTELDGVGFNEVTNENCHDQFESQIEGMTYGWLVCNDKPYLIIANKKIPFESAFNLSINPAVKPDNPLLQTALWWRIDKEKKTYLCIMSPLSENGIAANAFQYFLVEDAFAKNTSKYDIYFYFFDKDF